MRPAARCNNGLPRVLVKPNIRRWVCALALAIALALFLSWRAASPQSVSIDGLSAPVAVRRDRWAVPHLQAANERDLFLAQGYITAQDRLWQMLLRRQAARGQLAAWLGPDAAQADALLARQDFYAVQPDEPDAPTRAALEALALGVNAYIAQPGARPPELTLLKLRGVSAVMDPWTTQDSLAVARMLEWGQSLAEADSQLDHDLIASLGQARAQDLISDHANALSIPRSQAARQVLRLAGIPLFGSGSLSANYSAPVAPPAWYMMGLHAPSYKAAGASVAGLPGVVAGRGAERAWNAPWSSATLAAGRADAPCQLCAALQDVRQLGSSPQSEFARQLTPYLVALPPQGWLQQRVTPMMERWDYALEVKSAPAAVYEAWVAALGRRTFADELGAELYARYAASGRQPAALARLASWPDSPWWDDASTPQRETRDDTMQLAYADALDYLGRHYGDLHTIWEWGQMHSATFRHALGEGWPVSIVLNRGPIALAGDGFTAPTVPFDPSVSFEPVLVPSLLWRVSSTGAPEFALAGEQSGAPRLPVGGQLQAWQAGSYSPLLWEEAELKANARAVLVLMPR